MIQDRRLETPHIFPGFEWYMQALAVELDRSPNAAVPVNDWLLSRNSFCESVRDALERKEAVHIHAWEDAIKFNWCAIPRQVIRNGDWVYASN